MCVCVCVCVCVCLKRCECLQDWCQQVQDQRQWCGMVKAAAEGINEEMEEEERARKDERKRRREEVDAVPVASERWACSEPGCVFSAQSKAGLVNHTRQKHTTASQQQLRCPHCGRWFKVQGMTMHHLARTRR